MEALDSIPVRVLLAYMCANYAKPHLPVGKANRTGPSFPWGLGHALFVILSQHFGGYRHFKC